MKPAERIGEVSVETLKTGVETLIRKVVENAIMPHFQRLRTGEFHEKAPGEIVTIADQKAETLLESGLRALLPESRVVGEEASAANPGLLQELDEGLVWIVDPLDGTAHFAAGREPFGTMVALAAEGQTVMGWIYNPVPDLMFTAVHEAGAFVTDRHGNVRQLLTRDPAGVPIAGLATQFMPSELREATIARAAGSFELQPIPRCAAEHYPRLCRSENHIALFQRTLPWDHAAGALLLLESGGHIARWDGSPFKFYDGGLGILAATSRDLWDKAAQVLFAGGLLQAGGHEMLPASDAA